jgi:adenylate cyclase
MIDSINRHNGIINKFLGDGFMAVFGAPISTGEDVKNAVNASLEIVNTLEKMIQKGDIPATGIGIGLHCGDAVTGNVGSADRREYTIIGDVVNLASRIEQLNKSYGSRILVSEDVRQKISDFNCEEIGQVTVKGRQAPVRIFKLA